jgi:hypothetical protein
LRDASAQLLDRAALRVELLLLQHDQIAKRSAPVEGNWLLPGAGDCRRDQYRRNDEPGMTTTNVRLHRAPQGKRGANVTSAVVAGDTVR